jgi:hypothetical protein
MTEAMVEKGEAEMWRGPTTRQGRRCARKIRPSYRQASANLDRNSKLPHSWGEKTSQIGPVWCKYSDELQMETGMELPGAGSAGFQPMDEILASGD